jgi:hypothetical protein
MTEFVRTTGNSAAGRDVQYLIALLALALAFATLLIGVAGPDERLAIQGIPLSTVLYIAAFAVAVFTPCAPSTQSMVLMFLLPIALLGLTLPLSHDQEAGAGKLFNLMVSTILASILLAATVQRIGTETTLRLLIVVLGLLLAATVVYKLRYGFFERHVLFLMNGPIVFARLMGLGCLCSLVALRGPLRLTLGVIFFFAVVWTASKGPILALVATITGYLLLRGSRAERLVFAALLSAAVIGVIANYDALSNWPPLSRVFGALELMSAAGGSEFDSIGGRVLLIRASLGVLLDHPFGVGIGGWPAATGIRWAEYPHNFLLELWTEGGLLLGTAAALPYFAFLLRRVDAWWIICVFFLLCQQVSGDLLASRYWLTFSIVGFLCRSEGQRIPVAPLLRGRNSSVHGNQ